MRSQPDPFAWSPPSDQLDFDPAAADWADPERERARDRRRVRTLALAFGLLGLALTLATISTVVSTGLNLASLFRLWLGRDWLPESWRFAESTFIVWASFLASCLLWGRWNDRSWQGRVALLIVMGAVDLGLWAFDYAPRLGLANGELGHDWFRHVLGHALGWAEMSLIASLAADVAAHLGNPQLVEAARGTRLMASVGAMLWFLIFLAWTRWLPPVWPLARHPNLPLAELLLMWMGEMVLYTVILIQVTGFTVAAAHAAATALRAMIREDHAQFHPVHPSDAAWDELDRMRDRDRF